MLQQYGHRHLSLKTLKTERKKICVRECFFCFLKEQYDNLSSVLAVFADSVGSSLNTRKYQSLGRTIGINCAHNINSVQHRRTFYIKDEDREVG